MQAAEHGGQASVDTVADRTAVRAGQRAPLLPDFCAIGMLFPLVVIGELLAFVLVLKPGGATAAPLNDLALTSLFIQWVVLSSAGLLCVFRRHLNRLPPTPAALGALALVVVVVAALSEAAFWSIAAGMVPAPLANSTVVDDSIIWLAQQDFITLNLQSARHVDFLLRNVAIGTIVGAIALRYVLLQYRWKQQVEAEAHSRVAALQARIRPHFLFNSMNTIASFTRTRPDLAEQVVEDLADLFRAALVDTPARATLATELELVRQYLRIEGLRLGERLVVEWDTDDVPESLQMPPLILQPLVENCVYHGIEPLPDGGEVRIAGHMEGDVTVLELSNSVLPGGSTRHGNQMAQANVQERLRAFFGNDVGFDAHSDGARYAVSLRLPRKPQAGASAS